MDSNQMWLEHDQGLSADKSTPAWRSANPWPSTISLDSNNQTSFKAVEAHAADEPTHSTRLSCSWPSRAAQAMLHQAQAYIIRVLEESEQRPSFDLRGAKIVLGSPCQTHKLDYNLIAFGRAVGEGTYGGGLYQWMGCIAAQALAEIEQKLSLLVQGLVKARSDAVDGDGATTTQKRCQWTTEFMTAVIQQMALNVHALDQSTVNFGITESMVTDRAAVKWRPLGCRREIRRRCRLTT